MRRSPTAAWRDSATRMTGIGTGTGIGEGVRAERLLSARWKQRNSDSMRQLPVCRVSWRATSLSSDPSKSEPYEIYSHVKLRQFSFRVCDRERDKLKVSMRLFAICFNRRLAEVASFLHWCRNLIIIMVFGICKSGGYIDVNAQKVESVSFPCATAAHEIKVSGRICDLTLQNFCIIPHALYLCRSARRWFQRL